MVQPWDVTSDSELKAAVRAETGYDTDYLPDTDLDSIIDSAKRVLALRADVTVFYEPNGGDRGLAVALLGIVMAKAKGSVENSPVVVKNIAGDDVRFRTSDGSSLQLQEYEEMTQLGLQESTTTDQGSQMIQFSNDYYTGIPEEQ